eukprot:5683567-Prymnesium_polylepis.1
MLHAAAGRSIRRLPTSPPFTSRITCAPGVRIIHFGGGFHDIKVPGEEPWEPHWATIESDPDAWVVGMPET